MADTRAHKRSTSLAAAIALLLVSLCALAPGAAAAASGGTSPSSGSRDTKSSGSRAAAGTGRASLHVRGVRITTVKCVPSVKCSGNPREVSIRGRLLLGGRGLKAGMIVAFPARAGARLSSRSPAARLRQTSLGLLVSVPSKARSGRIKVFLSGGRYTSAYGPITVVRHALHPPRKRVVQPGALAASAGAMEGQGMWIWYLSRSEGGSIPAIAARAHAAGVTTLFIKSSDGSSNYWSQFSPQLVAELHANGLKACAWQYVYGTNPKGEAALGAQAVANGADCLVIDAESEYEGRYAAAQTYITELRTRIGPSYPLALASFPYVSYHPSLPYSVFMGPGAAQYNAPQMYWKTIGTSVDTVYANTYIANRIYGRPIFPLGQTYQQVSAADLVRFRAEAVDYGATGVSFWDWQETTASGWSALATPLSPLTSVTPNTSYPELRRGSKGDQVLWLQEHLASAIPSQETTGIFGPQTETNLAAFQSTRGIPANGVATAATWVALLALPPVAVDWTGGGPSG